MTSHPARSTRQHQLKQKYWRWISAQPSQISFILANLDKIDPTALNLNPNAYLILLDYPRLIRWDVLQYNANSAPVYQKYPHQITWAALKKNPQLQTILDTNYETIQW